MARVRAEAGGQLLGGVPCFGRCGAWLIIGGWLPVGSILSYMRPMSSSLTYECKCGGVVP